MTPKETEMLDSFKYPRQRKSRAKRPIDKERDIVPLYNEGVEIFFALKDLSKTRKGVFAKEWNFILELTRLYLSELASFPNLKIRGRLTRVKKNIRILKGDEETQ